ncbi:MAG: ATP-binding protein [Marinosulfonomonas sp.]|nr:ATP-binding protein [Marinosulfonomonas sp.]
METPPTQIYLVCGCTGAGKSTYSARLAQDIGGVRFSIDEWMQHLHNADQPKEMSFNWFYERVQRNCSQMRRVAKRLAELSVPAIFDCGLTNSQERAIFADWAETQGFSYELHFIDVDPKTRWRRVQKRNAEQAETYQFEVTRPMLDFIEDLWEAPTNAEMKRMQVKTVTL